MDTELISAYLTDLENFSSPDNRLDDYIQYLFSRVAQRSELNSAQSVAYHNRAALWAMAIKLGHRRFAYLVGLPRLSISNPNLTLKGRGDLALHFVYSVGLQLASGMEISFNLGEMKEVLDANRGGSGFSFADLVADTAGNLFATHLSQATPEVIKATQILAHRADENLYMPSITRKQEGLSQAEFQRQFGSTDSDKYQAEVAAIHNEILALPLYRN